MQDMQPDNSAMPVDNEGAMAKADLYKLANYSFKLFKQIDGSQQLEGWVQAKITKAADYIASVYHFMEYEMKFSEYGEKLENSDVYSESEKKAMMSKLMEAKEKVKELKKKQADKLVKKDMPVKEEKSSTGGEIDRSKKGVTKHTQNPDRFSDEPHTEPKSQAKSRSAADKKGDAAADKAEEKQGKDWEKRHGKGSVTRVKDGKKVDEGTTEVQYDKEGKRTGVKHTSTHKYSDEPHTEPKSQAKSRSAAEKAGDKAADKAAEKESKAYEKKHPGTVSRYKDGKKVNEASKSPKAKKDYDKDGEVESEKDEVIGSRRKAAGLDEASKPDFLDMDKDGDKKEPMKKAVADKKKKVKEAVAKAKAKMEGSIQGGVWVSSPDKGVPAPSGDPEGVPAKKAKSTDPKKAASTPAPAAPKKETVKESADLDRLKSLTKHLLG